MLRYGSVLNTFYLEDELRTTSAARLGENALALIVSPNGGILLFWPLATITFAALVGTAVVRALKGQDRPVRDARDRRRHRSHRRVDRRPCELVLALRLVGLGPAAEPPVGDPVLLVSIVAFGEPLSP